MCHSPSSSSILDPTTGEFYAGLLVALLVLVAGSAVLAWVSSRLRHLEPVRLIGLVAGGVLWCAAGVAVLLILSGLFSLGLPVFGVFGLPIALMFMMLWARAIAAARRRRAASVLGYLEQAVRLNLPIDRVLSAAAYSETGRLRQRLHAVREALASGAGVADALAQHVPEVPWRTRRLIASAEHVGRLPSVLADIKQRRLCRRPGLGSGADPMVGLVYGVVVACFTLIMVSLINALIIPKFIEIFDDFGTEMPAMTVWTFETAVTLSWWPVFFSVALIAVIAGLSLRFIVRGCPQDPGDAGWVDALVWRLPGLGGAVRSRSWAAAHKLTAEGLRAGCGLPTALREAGRAAPSRVVDRKLSRMADAIECSGDVGHAARQSGLYEFDRHLLAASSLAGEPTETYDFLARYHASKFSRTAALLQASVLPVVTLLLSVVVGWVTLSLLSPLAKLIGSMV